MGEENQNSAVVLLNWNHAEDTVQVVRRLLEWKSLKPVVYVVDNGSDDPSGLDYLPAEAVCLRNKRNRGFAGGNNTGIRAALDMGAEYIALCNYDAEIDESVMMTLLQVMRDHAEVGAVGPLMLETGTAGDTLYAGGRDISRYMRTRKELVSTCSVPSLIEVDYVPGTCILLRREVFEQCGLLDEDYFFSGEVADLCARVRSAGFRSVICSAVRIVHVLDKAPLRNALYAYYSFRNRFLYIRKHVGTLLIPIFYMYWTGLILLMVIRAVLNRNRAQARALILAWCDGVRGRWGNRNRLFIS
ncbi:MAG: glycosyltransferase family 2 protein [Spartobacteria bacterium]|nr:glycosyltransferase family 2 protein [Spartobacteria bacterium]